MQPNVDAKVLKICFDIAEIPGVQGLFQPQLAKLMVEALNYEQKYSREYCMSDEQGEFMTLMKHTLQLQLFKNKLNVCYSAAVLQICERIQELMRRWNNHKATAESYGIRTKCPRHQVIFIERQLHVQNCSSQPNLHKSATASENTSGLDPRLQPTTSKM